MRYRVLASDYDGTLAVHGKVAPPVVESLRRWRSAGGRLVLVTGRQLPDLRSVFPEVHLFDLIVAENGAVLGRPGEDAVLLAERPPGSFVTRLADAGVKPLSRGEVIVATLRPHLITVRRVIGELGLPLEIILNKEAVMVLPRGVHKGSGLLRALAEMEAEAEATVGVGDAENDLEFLRECGMAVAVADAIDAVRNRADRVTRGGAGAGVAELIDSLLGAP